MDVGAIAVYVVLSILFAADVARNPALTPGGKGLWILVLLLVSVFAWLVYAVWRMRKGRGL